jgi:hypothetical protein
VVVVQSDFGGSATAYHGDHDILVLDGASGVVRIPAVDINDPLYTPLAQIEQANGGSCAPDGHCGVAGGGPPTIGNFDGDAQPEVALAGAFNYSVFDLDAAATGMRRLWSAQTNDDSSRKTGSSLFDFDGDGTAEVVYADQHWLRVYDGPTGNVRYCVCNTSGTSWEYPVIADVDNRGAAQIVVAANDSLEGSRSCIGVQAADPCTQAEVTAGRTAGVHGVRVFRGPAPGWVSTRRIWNQHSYHVTNVSELGQIPAQERPNWSIDGLNDFRLNEQPGATNEPNLVPRHPSVGLNQCPSTTLFVEVHDTGWAAAPAGVPVTFYVEDGGAYSKVGTVLTTRALFPGQFELVSLVQVAPSGSGTSFDFRAVVNDPGTGQPPPMRECVAADNAVEFSGVCIAPIP